MQRYYYHKLDVDHWRRKVDFWFSFVVMGIVYGLLRYYFADPDLPGHTFGQFLYSITIPLSLAYLATILIYFTFTLGHVLLLSSTCRPLFSCFIAWAISVDYIGQKLLKKYLETSTRTITVSTSPLHVPPVGSIIFSCSAHAHHSFTSVLSIYKEGSLIYMIREVLDKHGM